ncbi:hypothetical protein, partial [Paenibacillus radicis (ex Gao et al. 2016)]|uniref:hypothetical protein n=1 Tax=Paenibacillus radicis (ex Gao et al. 2016) TaxID=1737354 RepID=UPI001E3FFA89
EVDRFGVEAQQCVELTNTNRSRAYPKYTPKSEDKRCSLFRILSGDPDTGDAKAIISIRILFSGRKTLADLLLDLF